MITKLEIVLLSLAVQVDELKDIIRVKPAQMAKKILDWLPNGAEIEIKRSLLQLAD
ncbi:hypothetical protein IQ270_18875 [Microcoleus sp. LEGE 07076]|uniref:hypothetical protein n=1 Tax=Microcoleus sp. LEGE 07076 TaxID=915322 RepID=UPI00187E5FBE|nr:hypothetical protein [Microcoleus sp. LEGE 07076]MBE9186690.1 hypothetical protein [Microcoleus sp. LEGE 07076]